MERQTNGVGIMLMVATLVAAGGVATAQTGSAGDSWSVPRTSAGHPDLQGVWANNSATPLERPAAFGETAELTDEERAELEQRVSGLLSGGDAFFGDGLVAAALDEDSPWLTFDAGTGNYGQAWMVARDIENRTSLIVDPPNGRLPALTSTAQTQLMERGLYLADHPADSWTDRLLSERCITFGFPNFFAGYNSYYQIVQTETHVAILQELIHDVRIIPLDDRPHVDDAIRQWYGDSRGRWEGDTLVIETRNFVAKADVPGALALKALGGTSAELHLVERFTRTGPDVLQYAATITNPGLWEAPWTAVVQLRQSDEAIFEYACHEGNIGMEGILAGHRAQEQAAVPAR